MTLQQEVKQINRKEQLSLVVTDDNFTEANGNFVELYAIKKHFKVEEERDSNNFFMRLQRKMKKSQNNSLSH